MKWLALLLCGVLAAAADEAQVTVRPEQVRGPVNRRVLGTNDLAYHSRPGRPETLRYSDFGSGVWDPVAARPVPEMVALAKEAGVTTLRWPGGCETHRYRWKETIGPVAQRPRQQFGLHEFLVRCAAIGAEPILTVAEYHGDAQDAADLVEYLNAPVGAHRGGGIDYAAIRAAQGHPEPWGVVWFEYGNESDHGDHQKQRYTPQEYARRYLAYRAAMRRVDPRVKLGLVLANTVWTPVGQWTETVLKEAGREADFLIHHAYLPGYGSNKGAETPAQLFANAFAVDMQFRAHYRHLVAAVKQLTGRRIPFAITEYNGSFVQEKPYPYRLTHANALVAGLIAVALLDPELPIDNAQYWQFANEYWGAVKGNQAPYVKRPALLMFSLLNRYLGDQLVTTETRCGRLDVPGGFGVRRMTGEPREVERELDDVPLGPWQIGQTAGVEQQVVADDVLAVRLTDPSDKLNYYHAARSAPAVAGASYRLSAEIRTEGLSAIRGAQLQIGDGRGWNATHSCSLSDMVSSANWTPITVDYQTLPDTTSVTVQARRLDGAGSSTGRIWYRKLKLRRFEPANLGAQPALTVLASTTRGGETRLVVFNKALSGTTELTVALPGVRAATAEALVAPALEATNETDPQQVQLKPVTTTVGAGRVKLSLPPYTLTGLTLTR